MTTGTRTLLATSKKSACHPISSCKNAALELPLVANPASAWNYGISIDFVGKAVEKVSGQSLDVYFRDNIFKPLGMNDTSFILRPDQLNRLVKVHKPGPN